MKTLLLNKLFIISCFLLKIMVSYNSIQAQISTTDFVTTWKTDNLGDTINSTSILIPTDPNSSYNYDIDWNNDGVFDDLGVTGDALHDYGTAGTYTIRIKGNFPRIYINRNKDAQDKIISVEQWGNIAWTSMVSAFQGAKNLIVNASDTPNLSHVSSMLAMFREASSFNQNINNWDVSNVTDMRFMFNNAIRFNQPLDNWNVSNVTDMRYMFAGAVSFNQNINDWNVSNVTDMRSMFSFENASDPFGLIQPKDAAFNQPLDQWNVSNVISMEKMFLGAVRFNQSLNSWNVGSVTDMEAMFKDAQAFNQPLNNWNVGNVVTMKQMFSYTAPPPFGGGPENHFNQPLNNWDVSSVTDMQNMFSFSQKFNQPLDSWDVSNVTTVAFMFSNAKKFNGTLNNWNVSNITDMGGMFQNAKEFNQPLNNWNISNVQLMDSMFWNANVFNQPLDHWDISKVTDMTNMLLGTILSTKNYDDTLIAWSTLSLQNNVTFHGGGSTYCNSESARNTLINTFGWTINDGGLDCSSLSLSDPFENKITVFPNPINDILNINTRGIKIEKALLYSIDGKLIKEVKVEKNSQINFSYLLSGIYHLKLISNQGVAIEKIAKK